MHVTRGVCCGNSYVFFYFQKRHDQIQSLSYQYRFFSNRVVAFKTLHVHNPPDFYAVAVNPVSAFAAGQFLMLFLTKSSRGIKKSRQPRWPPPFFPEHFSPVFGKSGLQCFADTAFFAGHFSNALGIKFTAAGHRGMRHPAWGQRLTPPPDPIKLLPPPTVSSAYRSFLFLWFVPSVTSLPRAVAW